MSAQAGRRQGIRPTHRLPKWRGARPKPRVRGARCDDTSPDPGFRGEPPGCTTTYQSTFLMARPLGTPLSLRPLGTLPPPEQILEMLIGAGLDPKPALHVYRA
jgi:hypothetical protein